MQLCINGHPHRVVEHTAGQVGIKPVSYTHLPLCPKATPAMAAGIMEVPAWAFATVRWNAGSKKGNGKKMCIRDRYYGINALSNNLIMVDRKLLKNPNGLILGTPGSGKSFSAKREIANCFLLTSDDAVSYTHLQRDNEPVHYRVELLFQSEDVCGIRQTKGLGARCV